jgi:hypothetical protein
VDSLRFSLLNIGSTADAEVREIKTETGDYSVELETQQLLGIINGFLRDYGNAIKYVNDRKEIHTITRDYIGGKKGVDGAPDVMGLHQRLNIKFSNSADFGRLTGLAFGSDAHQLGVRNSVRYDGPAFQIINLRLVSRVGPDGNQINEVIFSITQKSGILYNEGKFIDFYRPKPSIDVNDPKKPAPIPPPGGFEFMGGCTLIFDLDAQQLKYAISKPLLDMDSLRKNGVTKINMKRVETQYKLQNEAGDLPFSEYAFYFGNGGCKVAEPFAFLHQH